MDAHINNKSTLHALHGNPIKVMKGKKKTIEVPTTIKMSIQTRIFTQQCVKPTMLERKHMAKSINELIRHK
jgi:hypothetical protein